MRIVDYSELVSEQDVVGLYAELFGFSRKSVKNVMEDIEVEFDGAWFVEDYLNVKNLGAFIDAAIAYDLISYVEPPEDITIRVREGRNEKYVVINFKANYKASEVTLNSLAFMTNRVVIGLKGTDESLLNNDKVEVLLLKRNFELDINKSITCPLPNNTEVTCPSISVGLKLRKDATITFKQDTTIVADLPIEAVGTAKILGNGCSLELVTLGRKQPCIGIRSKFVDGSEIVIAPEDQLHKVEFKNIVVVTQCKGDFLIGAFNSNVVTETCLENAEVTGVGTKERTAAAFLDQLKEETAQHVVYNY